MLNQLSCLLLFTQFYPSFGKYYRFFLTIWLTLLFYMYNLSALFLPFEQNIEMSLHSLGDNYGEILAMSIMITTSSPRTITVTLHQTQIMERRVTCRYITTLDASWHYTNSKFSLLLLCLTEFSIIITLNTFLLKHQITPIRLYS